MKLVVTGLGEPQEVEVRGAEVVVEGASCRAHLTAIPGTPLRQLTVDGVSNSWVVESLGSGRWRVGRAGDVREVEVLDERTRHIRSLSGTQGLARGSGAVKAPMPGLVTKVLVAEGDVVAARQPLVVLEAMKMENLMHAPVAGTVAALHTAAGETVEKGGLLVTISPDAT